MIDYDPHERYGLRMTALALSFPTLRGADGVSPWDPDRFEAWLRSGAPGHGAKCAGRFVLSVWNSYHEWKCGGFDLHEALGCWDERHCRAFVAWIAKPCRDGRVKSGVASKALCGRRLVGTGRCTQELFSRLRVADRPRARRGAGGT